LGRRHARRLLDRVLEILPAHEAGVGAEHVGVAELGQCLGRERAARAAGAVQNDLGVLVGQLLLGLHLEVRPGDVDRTRDEPRAKFVLLAHVHQREGLFLTLVEPSLQLVEGEQFHALPNFGKQVAVGLGHKRRLYD
jgi:hypothetical protein